MLAELRLILDQEQIGYQQSSSLQGVLMETISPDYAARLHQQAWNPYSQALIKEDGKSIWVIKTMAAEAYGQIIVPLCRDSFREFEIRQGGQRVHILGKELSQKPEEELFAEFYQTEAPKYLEMEFMTPTAFRSNGRYQCYPAPHFIYQSLMRKFSAVSEEMDLWDADALEQLERNTEIAKYRLMTALFPLEGIRIAGFRGRLAFRLAGTDTMARYARLLLRFGEYSGIGIKTAMGMGAFRLLDGKEKAYDRR